MTQVAEVYEYNGHKQHESRINTTYDVPWTININNDTIYVRFSNPTQTQNGKVSLWVEDSEGNGDLTYPFEITVPPGEDKIVAFWEFGHRADGVSPRDECILHTRLENVDDPGSGLEFYHYVYS